MDLKNTSWVKKLSEYESRMIFGAKGEALKTFGYLTSYGLNCEGFVVSSHNDNPVEIHGIPVYTFNEISTRKKEQVLIIITQSYGKTEEMEKILREQGFKNIIPSACQFLTRWNGKGRIDLWDELYLVHDLPGCNLKERSVCLYIVTSHLNTKTGSVDFNKNKYMEYIQAGAALTDENLCRLKDNTGKNISEQNQYYCELTAGYWIANNDRDHEYVGLCHYSRILDLSEQDINNICGNHVDVVLAVPYIAREEILINSATVLREVMEKHSNYKDVAEIFFGQHSFIPGNIVLCKKEIFIDYYNWMFQILDEIKSKITERGEKITIRFLGYVAEHLTNLYFIKRKSNYKICFAPFMN